MSNGGWKGASPEVRDILDRCYKQGYRVEQGGTGHWKVFITGDRRQWLLDNGFEFDSRASHMVSMSSTPSDPRAMQNGMKYLKWMGFDYEPPKPEKPQVVKATPADIAKIKHHEPSKSERRVVPLTYEQLLESLTEWGSAGASINELVTEHGPKWGIPGGYSFDEIAASVSSKLRITGMKRGEVERLPKEMRPYSQKKTYVYVATAVQNATGPVEVHETPLTADTCPDRCYHERHIKLRDPAPTVIVESLSDLQEQMTREVVTATKVLGLDQAAEIKELIDMLMEMPLSIVENEDCRTQLRRIAPLIAYVSE